MTNINNTEKENRESPKYAIIIAAAVILAAIVSAGAYFLPAKKQKEENLPPILAGGEKTYEQGLSGAIEKTGDFYNWYIRGKFNILDNADDALNAALKREFISKNFAAGAKARLAITKDNAFDIFTCTSHKPKSYNPKNTEVVKYAAGETDTHIKADIGIEGHYTDVRLQEENGSWFISSITCPIVPKINN